MKIIRPGLIVLLIFLVCPNLHSQSELNEINELILSGKKEIYNYRFQNALKIFQLIQEKYPEFPHGYFYESYLTTLLFVHDRTNDSLDARLHETVEKAVEVGEEFNKKYYENPEALYYLGVSHGLLGIYHAVNRSYFNGYIHGRKGKIYLEKVVKIDSTYYDAYLGLGIYHYYVDLLPGILKFFAKILGFSGDRERGMREIRLVKNKGRFFRVEAEFGYAGIRYFLEGAKREALSILFQLRNRYPTDPAFTLFVGYYYRRIGRVRTAISYFTSVPDTYADHLPLIYLLKYYNLGVCSFRMNDFAKSEKIFQELSENPVRKSLYYKAAILSYRGILADLRFDRRQARIFLHKIKKNKETKYWYYSSRLFYNTPMDSLLYYYVAIENDIFIANFREADKKFLKLNRILSSPRQDNFFKIKSTLVKDLQARLEFRRGQIKLADGTYRGFIKQVSKIKDEFQRSWIYIQYARVLRELKEWKQAKKYLDKAADCRDDYTKLIVERERFIIKNLSKNFKSQEQR